MPEWRIECFSSAKWAEATRKWGWSEHNVSDKQLWELEAAIIQVREHAQTIRDKMHRFDMNYRIYNTQTGESIPFAALGL